MYKPFGYDTIAVHLHGYQILPKHIADLFPHFSLMTKEQRRRRYRLSLQDLTYADYYGPFK